MRKMKFKLKLEKIEKSIFRNLLIYVFSSLDENLEVRLDIPENIGKQLIEGKTYLITISHDKSITEDERVKIALKGKLLKKKGELIIISFGGLLAILKAERELVKDEIKENMPLYLTME